MEESKSIISGNIGGKIECLPTQRYDIPSVNFGEIFFATLSVEIDGIRGRKWNSERVVFFSCSSCNGPKPLVMPNIFACTYSFDLTTVIMGPLTKSRNIQSEEQRHRTFRTFYEEGNCAVRSYFSVHRKQGSLKTQIINRGLNGL